MLNFILPATAKLLFPKRRGLISAPKTAGSFLRDENAQVIANRFCISMTIIVRNFEDRVSPSNVNEEVRELYLQVNKLLLKTMNAISGQPKEFKQAIGILVRTGNYPDIKWKTLLAYDEELKSGVLKVFGVDPEVFERFADIGRRLQKTNRAPVI